MATHHKVLSELRGILHERCVLEHGDLLPNRSKRADLAALQEQARHKSCYSFEVPHGRRLRRMPPSSEESAGF